MWVFHSPIGDLKIKRMPDGTYGLEYRGIIWECCNTPQQEADNVYQQCTGCSDWDLYSGSADVPHDLSEWEHV